MRITKDTKISTIVQNAPEAMPMFQQIGMHCMGCAMASGETLEQACWVHGVDTEWFVNELKAYLMLED